MQKTLPDPCRHRSGRPWRVACEQAIRLWLPREADPRMHQIGHLAVLKQYRSYAFGKSLMQAAHMWLQTLEKPVGTDETDSGLNVYMYSQVRLRG